MPRNPHRSGFWTALALGVGLLLSGQESPGAEFRRGDTNGDSVVDLSDGIATLLYLFSSGLEPGCYDAADADDNSQIELTDAIFVFSYLFLGGDPMPSPGPARCGEDPSADSLDCAASPCTGGPGDADLESAGHLLDRIAYGATPAELDRVLEFGISSFVAEQLDPSSLEESSDVARLEAGLFTEVVPTEDKRLVPARALWRYRKGNVAAPAGWAGFDFDDSTWDQGPSGFGYGDGDDNTIFADMRMRADDPATPEDESQPGYASIFLRKTFDLADPATVDHLLLSIDYDDGFAAYLNGTAVARANLPSGNVGFSVLATGSHDAGAPQEFNLDSRRSLLRAGKNVLAVQVHNTALTSSDLSAIPELISRTILPGEPRTVIRGVNELQRLVHVRGIYSTRQLETVLAEFWENHFTTDYDKLVEWFDDLDNSDATDAMSRTQAEAEAAQVEYLEYEFLRENALGYFGDLLLGSASSPAMVVYLDNVLNLKGAPNENYAREILELSAFGVDNRYVQKDLEELARAFTGWSICKAHLEDVRPFPESARDPVTVCGVQFEDTPIVGLGTGWRYFKGRSEPTPVDGTATTGWAQLGFDDSTWTAGSTGIGYGDGDDATNLSDMRNSYRSVYVRRTFSVEDPSAIENLVLAVDYDDGFIAYLNGVEVARSESLEDAGAPPAFNDYSEGREAGEEEAFNLDAYRDLLRPAPETNVLAIQVHNSSLDSSDLSMRPRLVSRHILPGSIENGDSSGVWIFRFRPEVHDTAAKRIFAGTPYEVRIPAGRTGANGIQDAIDVIDSMVSHPSTAEFICIKLIQRFVSDEITLRSFKEGTARPELVELLADMIAAWNSTERPGHIGTVVATLLDAETRTSAFWSEFAYRSKVKTPIEFVNSSMRILDGITNGSDLPAVNDRLGMHLFTRDEPDGWSELGFDWIDTGTMLDRVNFGVELSGRQTGAYAWNAVSYLDSREITSAEDIVAWVQRTFFRGSLPQETVDLLLMFLTTDANGAPRALNRANTTDFRTRVQEFFGLVLSLPEWHFQ
jgi:uncharacterized protein (DUF1800 family)